MTLLELEEVLIDRAIYWDEQRRYCQASKREHERNLIGGYEIVVAECAWLLDALRFARGLGPWPVVANRRVWPKRRKRGKGKFKRLWLRTAKELERALLENPENPS